MAAFENDPLGTLAESVQRLAQTLGIANTLAPCLPRQNARIVRGPEKLESDGCLSQNDHRR